MAIKKTRLDIALKYAANGIRVFPVKPNSKSPYANGGYHTATVDKETITSWFGKEHKNALIAAPNDQFTVIDVDYTEGNPTGRILADMTIDELMNRLGHPKKMMVVTTGSGGKHLYFKKDESLRRMIRVLPNIDLLADGGCTVLPDNILYIPNVKNPWDAILDLPELDTDILFQLSKEQESVTQQCKVLDKLAKSSKKLPPEPEEKTEPPPADCPIDITTGECLEPSAAGRSDRMIDISDPNLSMLVDGKLEICEGELESLYVNKLFHNKEIQLAMANFMGIVPDKRSFHSLFPDHVDENPSMTARWSENGSHIIVCDWSMHHRSNVGHGGKYMYYNLVQLYAMIKYNSDKERLSKQEFVMWFIRLLHDAKICDLTPYIKKYAKPLDDLSKAERRMAEGIALLDAVKSRYHNYDGTMTFSTKFASAWNGIGRVDTYTAKLKISLIQKGYIRVEGIFDCSGGKRTDGFMNTKIISMITEDNKDGK